MPKLLSVNKNYIKQPPCRGGVLLIVFLLFSMVSIIMLSAYSIDILWQKTINGYRKALIKEAQLRDAAQFVARSVLTISPNCFTQYSQKRYFTYTKAWWQHHACQASNGVYYLIEPMVCHSCLSSVDSQCYFRIELINFADESILTLQTIVGSAMLDCGQGIIEKGTLSIQQSP